MDPLRAHLQEVKRVLRAGTLSPRKRWGQHFLLDPVLLERIVASAGDLSSRKVIEVGPGPGGLTAALLLAGAEVAAIEIDEGWASFAERSLSGLGRLRVLRQDVREGDGRWLSQFLQEEARSSAAAPCLVGNLPYQIASPLLVDLVRGPAPPTFVVATVQEEVANRLLAQPGSGRRGLLTLLVGMVAEVRRLFRIPKGRFTPPPQVSASVIEVVPDPERQRRVQGSVLLDRVLRCTFAERRKMLRSTLARILPASVLLGLDAGLLTRRPQDLSGEAWLALAQDVRRLLGDQGLQEGWERRSRGGDRAHG